MNYLAIPESRKSEFLGGARFYYVVEFTVESKGYTGKTMVPSDVEMSEDQIFSAVEEFLKNHFTEVFGKYKFAADVAIIEAFDSQMGKVQ